MAHRQLRLPYLYELRNSTTARVKYINIIFSTGRTNEITTQSCFCEILVRKFKLEEQSM